MSDTYPDELTRLLDAAVAKLSDQRRTFSEEEALGSIWEAGYEVAPQFDPRFELAWPANDPILPHWRLSNHVLANDRLLDLLTSGNWDGRELDDQLAYLSKEDDVHYVFYPHDSRFITTNDGRIDLADREFNIALDPRIASTLNRLSDALITGWRSQGAEPWTIRQITQALADLSWSDAWQREAWLFVRSWLLGRQDIARVGQDYWLPSDQIPAAPSRTRLAVLPVGSSSEGATSVSTDLLSQPDSMVTVVEPRLTGVASRRGQQGAVQRVQWTVRLRTVHINEGFLPVPSTARAVYPARGTNEGVITALRGIWHVTNERLWLWLDRAHNRLYGTPLAQQLEWCSTGDILRVTWDTDGLIFRIEGNDQAVQQEEGRLVDREALAALRGGLGESYRRSIQIILEGAPDGLTLAQVVDALRERQQHDVPRNTVRAVLSTGGFVQRDKLWFSAPDGEEGRRRLRQALVETLPPPDDRALTTPVGQTKSLRNTAQSISVRLAQIIRALKNEG